jgi:oxygen-independent coproporphyrinogen-3 oxidase
MLSLVVEFRLDRGQLAAALTHINAPGRGRFHDIGMKSSILAKYDRPVPRYTSYPTAPHFGGGIGPDDYESWLTALPGNVPLSLYFHIPFCDSLCWFCGCHTKIVRRYEPVAKYLAVLRREVDLVAGILGKARVSHLHFGGGSPTILQPDDLAEFSEALRHSFQFTADCDFAVEIDPRDADRDLIAAWARAGATRASLGVQDVNPEVQQAINRIQPFDQTKRVADWLREEGILRINMDLMYGLPHQTVERVLTTVDRVVGLAPDRIALFGYAHVPWMKRHQRLIPEAALPDNAERLRQSEAAAARLEGAGYLRIGLDHFARPGDSLATALAEGRLHRNFQGYTSDEAKTLIGFGPSAIGALPQGYVQNEVPMRDYAKAVEGGRLPIARGVEITAEDELRRSVIERLMCDLRVDLGEVCHKLGFHRRHLARELKALAPLQADGIVAVEGTRVYVVPDARPLLRAVCAVFDRYLNGGPGRHAAPV